jgi:glycerophosphoryl diester phosphodiesterase
LFYFILVLSLGGFGRKQGESSLFSQDQVFLFAHRGVTDMFPENSREAIERARTLGFKGLEVDIRRSADDQFILFHDEVGKRLLGIDEEISALTKKQMDMHTLLFNGKPGASRVITLQEMLEDFSDDFIIYLDMKLGDLHDVDDLLKMISAPDLIDSVIFASPSFLVVLYAEFRYPEVLTAMEGFNAGNEWILNFIPKKIQPDFLSGQANKTNKEHMDWLRKKQLDHIKIVYGIDKTNYQSMLDLGVKNMITDYLPNP